MRRTILLSIAIGISLASAGGSEEARPLGLRAAAVGVVTSIADPDVRVRCAAPASVGYEAYGHADRAHRLIELAPFVCRRLNALVARPVTASPAQAEALLVLVHESVHLSAYPGRTDEALTECRAVQLVREAALRIGVPDNTARMLGHEALRYHERLPGPGNWLVGLHEVPSYQSPDCHDGGPLDLHPDSEDWPN